MTYWSRLKQTFWFLPAVFCATAVVLAESLIFIDQRLEEGDLGPLDVLVTRVGEAGSRDLLGAIAGSMLTVASTTFSITIAVLALSSSTYGPRLVRNFMANRGNQVVLGTFVATFLYSLLVLRSIRVLTDGSDYFVPHLAVNMAVLLAVLAIGVLVYFIHHISDSVQVWTLSEQVHDELVAAVDDSYPDEIGRGGEDGEGVATHEPAGMASDGVVFSAPRAGYVLSIDQDDLFSLAKQRSLVVSLRVRPGQHVVEGAALGVLWPADQVTHKSVKAAQAAIGLGRARTPHEDVEFSALLLEEMAVRALSPGTNDPYTAINALDQLAAGLVRFAGRRTPSAYRYDDEGQLRVIAPHASLVDVLDHLLDSMRTYAVQHPNVLHRTLELLEQVSVASGQPAVLARCETHVQRLAEAFLRSSPQACDGEALSRRADEILGQLRRPPAGSHPASKADTSR